MQSSAFEVLEMSEAESSEDGDFLEFESASDSNGEQQEQLKSEKNAFDTSSED